MRPGARQPGGGVANRCRQRHGSLEMADQKSRRGFLQASGAAVAIVAASGIARADEKKGAGTDGKPFSGTSNKGLIQEALDAAIEAALKSATGADRQVKWTLKTVSGERGGI